MNIRTIIYEVQEADREAWDSFVLSSNNGSFLQSWVWGEFQKTAGFHIKRYFVQECGGILAAALFVERHLPLGQKYFYAPWGPVFRENLSQESFEKIFSLMSGREFFQKNQNPVHIRIEPHLEERQLPKSVLGKSKFISLKKGIQPKDTLVLDLSKTNDDILKEMHSKTRYNIRVAMRHGVEVKEKTNDEGFKIFMDLAREVEAKGDFHYHPASYYQIMIKTLGEKGMLKVLVAEYKGKPLAAGIFIRYGNIFTYAHGASTKAKAHVMAPYLLHWEAIEMAKREGSLGYDFFGIAPNEDTNHSWFGITRFKKGFGGKELHYVGAADTVNDKVRYQFYNLAQGMKNLLR